MAKKNPFVFTLGFNKNNPSHIRAVEILNETENKAQLIACALLQYFGESENAHRSEFSMEAVQPIVATLVKQELQKALQGLDISTIASDSKTESEEIVDLTDDTDPMPQNRELARNAIDAMSAFRKM